MKKLIPIISAVIVFLAACASGFNQNKAEELLEKNSLDSDDYNELIQLYDDGMADAIEFSKKEAKDLSESERNEVLTVFAIGMRLSKDEDKLSESQKKEFERINQKGTDELKK
ncbi:hypothetical protein [Cupriavidus metallidurans]|uniref:Lipoprotein n=1 Tax=uncultured bacterium BAC25G1 TaxID=1329523 RepID=R4JIG4_9BACT|nr:hypothetical protein [Cupriavidus metallidurans]AGK84821.1 hypothetical protein metaSSY_00670 [uncultured bacterium BAC25G1]